MSATVVCARASRCGDCSGSSSSLVRSSPHLRKWFVLVDCAPMGITCRWVLQVMFVDGRCPSSGWCLKVLASLQKDLIDAFLPWLLGVEAWAWLLGPLLGGLGECWVQQRLLISFEWKNMDAQLGAGNIHDVGEPGDLEMQAASVEFFRALRGLLHHHRVFPSCTSRVGSRFGVCWCPGHFCVCDLKKSADAADPSVLGAINSIFCAF